MFEDSTFESMGRIRTRSRGWMMATFGLNASIVVALILIPLIYPEAMPRIVNISLLTVPPPPPPQPAPEQPKPVQQFHGAPQMDAGTLVAPRQIPISIARITEREEPAGPSFLSMDGPGAQIPSDSVFRSQRPAVAAAEKKGPVRISSSVVAGMILHKTIPVYPPIAVASRTEGTVLLQATISKTGAIDNLRVMSGPALLQQAAIDAVSNWKYRPFLLNGEPVEVETTVNVIFTLGH